jgi:hypothetical protein
MPGAGLSSTPFKRNPVVAATRAAPRTRLHVRRVKPIESVEVGDLVWAWDEAMDLLVKRPVRKLFQHGQRPAVEIRFAAAGGTEGSVTSTTEHPFWVEGRGWVGACELQPGDVLKSIDEGAALRVLRVLCVAARFEVFNFEVHGAHNYFVGASGALVHNLSDRRPAIVREPNGDRGPNRDAVSRTDAEVTVDTKTLIQLSNSWVQTLNPEWRAKRLDEMTSGVNSSSQTLHMQVLARASEHLLPTDLQQPIRLSNGQNISAVITSLDLNSSAKVHVGSFKAFARLHSLDGRLDMGVATNLPGKSPVSVAAEATLAFRVAEYVPNFAPDALVYVATPRLVEVRGKVEFVFDTEPRTSALGIGMVMEAGPPDAAMFKAKSALATLNKAGKLEGVPGYDTFAPHYSGGLLATALTAKAVMENNTTPLLDRARENAGILAARFPFDEGARAIVQATRDMVDVHRAAIVDAQYLPSTPREWTNPLTGQKSMVNLRNIDPLDIVQEGRVHPLVELGGVDMLDLSFEHWSGHNKFSADLMEIIMNARARFR